MSSILIRRANVACGGVIPPQPTEVDLTDLFTWTNGTYVANGNASTTSATKHFKKSNLVDVSAYAGKTMIITWCAYINGSGNRPNFYGIAFYDSSDVLLSIERVSLATGYTNETGYTIDDYEVIIPDTAVSFKTTYFRDNVTFTVNPFSCKIIL